MLKILGRANSINVQKVLWCAGLLGIRYERHDVGGAFGGNTTPAYLAKNPNGRVPVIEDDDFVLWESNAIVRYLAAKHGMGTLWPMDLRVRADADRWMDWQATTLTPAMTAVFWGLIRTAEDKRDHAAIDQSIKDSAAAMVILDRALSGRAFVAGDQCTMGDIPVACATHRWLQLPVARPRLAHVARWYRQLMTTPAAAGVLTVPIT